MATPTQSSDAILQQLLDKQDQLLKRVAALEKPQKDLWDKLGASAGLLVAIVGGVFSYLYSSHQSQLDTITQVHEQKLQQVQTVGTFMPYLVGNDDAARSVALSEVRSILNADAAIQIVDELDSFKKAGGNAAPDPVAIRFLQRVVDNGKSAEEKEQAQRLLTRMRVAPVAH